MALHVYTSCELLDVLANHLTILREAKHKNENINGMHVCMYSFFVVFVPDDSYMIDRNM
jgi:hypothetical protein